MKFKIKINDSLLIIYFFISLMNSVAICDVFDSYYKDKQKIYYDLKYYNIHPFYSYNNELMPTKPETNIKENLNLLDPENEPLFSDEKLKINIKSLKSQLFGNKNEFKFDNKKSNFKQELDYFKDDNNKYLTRINLNRNYKISELLKLEDILNELKNVKTNLLKKSNISSKNGKLKEKSINLNSLAKNIKVKGNDLKKLSDNNNNIGSCENGKTNCRLSLNEIKEYILITKNDPFNSKNNN